MSGQPKKPVAPACGGCKKSLPAGTPRVFVDPMWLCSDCLYLREVNPDAALNTHVATPRYRKQQETLFEAERRVG